MPPQEIPLASLSLDPAFQAREKVDREWVASLAAVLEAAPEEVAPILVYELPTGQCVVVDGFHRVEATRSLGRRSIRAQIKGGSVSEALDAAAIANAHAQHKPLTYKERRALAIQMDARHRRAPGLPPEPGWTPADIARKLGFSNDSAVRHILEAEAVKAGLPARNFTLSDAHARALRAAPQPVQAPLARAALGQPTPGTGKKGEEDKDKEKKSPRTKKKKWTAKETEQVAKAARTAVGGSSPGALPAEQAARLAEVAAQKGWTARETQAAFAMTQQMHISPAEVVERLATETLIPAVRTEAGEPAALPETWARLLAGEGPSPGEQLTLLVRTWAGLRHHAPADVARSLQPVTVEVLRSEWGALREWVLAFEEALSYKLEVLR